MSESAVQGLEPQARTARLLSDTRLARRAAGGDERAFAAIFRRYHQDLYRYCVAILGSPQDAQDALQNTMVKVLAALPGEEREIQLKPWLYRIAHNEAIDLRRVQRPTEPLDGNVPVLGGGPAETAESRARMRELLADIEALPERQRGALIMRELSGLSFEQIGEAFDTSPAVARQTIYEARLSLQRMSEGREMDCAAVTKALSDGDGRLTRRRELRAHLRNCDACRHFEEGLQERQRDFAAIAPLPAVVASGLLHSLIGSGAGSAGGGLLGGLGLATGKTVAGSVLAKSAATVAVVAAVGVSADRGGVVDLGIPGGASTGGGANAPKSAPPAEAGGVNQAGPVQGVSPTQAAQLKGAKGLGPGTSAAGKQAAGKQDAAAKPPAAAAAGQTGPPPHAQAHKHGQKERPQGPPTTANPNRGKAGAKGHRGPSSSPAAEKPRPRPQSPAGANPQSAPRSAGKSAGAVGKSSSSPGGSQGKSASSQGRQGGAKPPSRGKSHSAQRTAKVGGSHARSKSRAPRPHKRATEDLP